MDEKWTRMEPLLGEQGLAELKKANILVFGVGGVGSYVIEALARCGIGHISLVDKDIVEESNINRQLVATVETIGMSKVKVMCERILSINPSCEVTTFSLFYLPETAKEIDFSKYDYVVDAVDTITAKIEIIQQAKVCNVPIISSMGTGNKLDATLFRVADIFETSICPLAKVMRRELKKRKIANVKVVYSLEEGIKSEIPSSVSFVPSVAGLLIAGEVIKDLTIKKQLT